MNIENHNETIDNNKYFCEEHSCKKIIVSIEDDSHVLICRTCYEEDDSLQTVRHKFMSSFSKEVNTYFFILFSTFVTLFSLVFEIIESLHSMSFNTQFFLKFIGSLLLVIYAEILIRRKALKPFAFLNRPIKFKNKLIFLRRFKT